MRNGLPILLIAALAAQALPMRPADGSRPVDWRRLPAVSHADPAAEIRKLAPVSHVDDYAYENLLLEETTVERQQFGSYGKLLAVSSDGVAHGVFLGGGSGPARRAKGWCVDTLLTLTGPSALLEQRGGFATCGVTSAQPPSQLPANAGVAGFAFMPGDSWFGVDFSACSLAFLTPEEGGGTLSAPHIAVDHLDQIHGVGESGDSLFYDLSPDGQSTQGRLLVDAQGVSSAVVAAATQAPGAALAWLKEAACAPPILDMDAYWLHNDVLLHETRDPVNNLRSVIQGGPPQNLTRFGCPESTAPFRYGAFASPDLDLVYDEATTPGLHLAFPMVRVLADSMLWEDLDQQVIEFTPIADIDLHSSIWHLDPASGQWGHIAGWLTGTDEADTAPYPDAFRVSQDRVQLAHDPQTGLLYALWNAFPAADTSDVGVSNGELMMACSADGGASWGPRVNVSQSATPGCLPGECESETNASLAAVVSGGFLHLEFTLDSYPADDLVSLNQILYMRVPVAEVPPPAGAGWDAAGHVGLSNHARPWWFTEGHPETLRVIDKLSVYNEGRQDRHLSSLVLYHDFFDETGTADLWSEWGVLTGDPVQPGQWLANPTPQEWDGRLPALSALNLRLSMGHRGLPLREQVFAFTFDDGSVSHYRYQYLGPAGQGSLVLPADLGHLEDYSADTLYFNAEAEQSPPSAPASFALPAAVPNPFNPATEISFTLAAPAEMRLTIFNLMGERVATLVDGPLPACAHRARFDGASLASGVYLAVLEADGWRETSKLLLVK